MRLQTCAVVSRKTTAWPEGGEVEGVWGGTTESGARGLGAPRLPDRPTSFLPSYPAAAASVPRSSRAILRSVLCKVSWFCFAPRVKVHAELIDRLEIGLSISVLISRCVPFAIDGLGRGTGERAGHFRSAKRMSNFSMEKFHKKNKKTRPRRRGTGKAQNSERTVHARRDRARKRKSEEDLGVIEQAIEKQSAVEASARRGWCRIRAVQYPDTNQTQ